MTMMTKAHSIGAPESHQKEDTEVLSTVFSLQVEILKKVFLPDLTTKHIIVNEIVQSAEMLHKSPSTQAL